MRIGSLILVLWLVVGGIAAVQRDYFSSKALNCNKAGSATLTVLAGPLNYVGVNPKVNCKQLPEPSK